MMFSWISQGAPDRAEPPGTTLKLGNRSQISPRRVTRIFLPGQIRNESILKISVKRIKLSRL